ncbi:hypothetical protein DPMN_053222 [Dreissena polymorpha]|uniref:Uncharacterized protein n=1 Tax=Dreissena polymorpha TaxID=45954 RepID=A0A9D4CLQ4_DREPO|nr:hypothetical protein DPMN_053222 [Dreissena polymorpha]
MKFDSVKTEIIGLKSEISIIRSKVNRVEEAQNKSDYRLGKLEERVGDISEMSDVLHMDLQALSINDKCNERRITHIETQLNIIESDRLKCSLRLFGLKESETNKQELLALVANEVLDVTEESDSLDITSIVSVRRIGEKRERQAREDGDDEREHDDTRMQSDGVVMDIGNPNEVTHI